MSRFRERYGAGPLHVVAVAATAAVAGYAVVEISGLPAPLGFAVWFVGAVVAHDLVSFPLYSLLDRIGGRTLNARPDRSAYNYVRVPAILSGILFIVWFPFILGLSSEAYELKSGRMTDPFLGRWLLVTAGLFLVSGLALAISRRRAAGRRARVTDAS